MKVTSQELAQLQKIERLFGEIDSIYSGLSDNLRVNLNGICVGGFQSTLGYFSRWGYKTAQEVVEECAKDSKLLLDEFKEYCSEKAQKAGNRYNQQHLEKYMVIDKMWDSDRDDCDMYDRTAEYLIDEYPEWFENCETIEECERVIEEKKAEDEELFLNDYLDDERMNLSFGTANLQGAVIIEVGSIGRWNGTLTGLNILDASNIGELLTSNHPQWMCYVDKATGDFCKREYHHDGSNHYDYRELICDKDEFKEMLEQAKPGELAELVSKYSKSIGTRVADVYGWDLEAAATIEAQLKGLIKEGYSLKHINDVRKMLVLDGLSIDEAIVNIDVQRHFEKCSLDSKVANASSRTGNKENGLGKTKENERGE